MDFYGCHSSASDEFRRRQAEHEIQQDSRERMLRFEEVEWPPVIVSRPNPLPNVSIEDIRRMTDALDAISENRMRAAIGLSPTKRLYEKNAD